MADKKPDKKPNKKAPEKKPEDNLNDVGLDVAALKILSDLNLSKAQLKAFAELAATTSPKPQPRRQPQLSARFRSALLLLRDALVESDALTTSGR